MARDYYAVLGVPRSAGEKELRQAYRRLARKHHPDVNPGSKDAGARFKEINEAYQGLSDSDKRAKYDRFGDNWRHADQVGHGTGGGASGSSPFERLFQRGRPGGRAAPFDSGGSGSDDLFQEFLGGRSGRTAPSEAWPGAAASAEVVVDLSLEEAYRGASRIVEIPSGPGGRAPRRLEVKIPPGVDTGSRVHIPTGRGRGDLYLHVQVQPHPSFQRQGDDLSVEVPVPVDDAVLGAEIEVPTLKGRVLLKVPPETQNGRAFRLAGQGMPRLQGGEFGDLYATVRVVLPTPLSEQQREVFRELRRLRGTT